jgi:hypothetical protein
MDEDQLQAYQLALSGHNLLILGQAGTGKLKYEHGQLGKCLRNSLIRQCHM